MSVFFVSNSAARSVIYGHKWHLGWMCPLENRFFALIAGKYADTKGVFGLCVRLILSFCFPCLEKLAGDKMVTVHFLGNFFCKIVDCFDDFRRFSTF